MGRFVQIFFTKFPAIFLPSDIHTRPWGLLIGL